MTPLGYGTYQIVNRNSGNTLEVYGQDQSTAANVDQWPWLGLAWPSQPDLEVRPAQ